MDGENESPLLDLKAFPWIVEVINVEASVATTVTLGGKRHFTPKALSAGAIVEKYGVDRETFKSHLKNEVDRSEACWSLPFTLLLVISYALFAILHDDALHARSLEESLEHEIVENANFAYVGSYIGHKNLYDVNSIADFWSWLSMGLVPLALRQETSFHEGYDYTSQQYIDASGPVDRGLWLNYNRIVGGIRLRQERSGEGDSEEPCTSPKSLLPFYRMQCVQGHGYELDPEMRSARYSVHPRKVRWLYTYEDFVELQGKVWQLERQQWYDRNTKKIEVAIPIYNAEFGIHTIVYVNFFMSRGGHIWKKPIQLSTHADFYPTWYFGVFDIVWLLCILYIFVSEMLEIRVIVRRSGVSGIWREYLGFWNIFDWISLVCAVVVIIFFVVTIDLTMDANNIMKELPPSPDTQDTAGYDEAVQEYMRTVESSVQTGHLLRLAVFMYPFVIIIRLFKAYAAQPRLALMTSTLSKAANDLIHFSIVFSSVFLAFVVAGASLFGRQVASFGTFFRAMFACYRILFGELMWEELKSTGRIEAAIWLVLFIVLVVMILLNMLLAIIMDHYIACKEIAMGRETLWEETTKAWTRWKLEKAGKSVPIGRVLHALVRKDRQRLEMHGNGEEEEEAEDDVLRIESLCHVYAEEWDREMDRKQAMQLLADAVTEYYKKHFVRDEMEEAVFLVRKIDHRTCKMRTWAEKQKEETTVVNEIESLKDLARELSVFTEELRMEREAQRREADELRAVRHGLLLQLQLQMPSASLLASGSDGAPSRQPVQTRWRLTTPSDASAPGGFALGGRLGGGDAATALAAPAARASSVPSACSRPSPSYATPLQGPSPSDGGAADPAHVHPAHGSALLGPNIVDAGATAGPAHAAPSYASKSPGLGAVGRGVTATPAHAMHQQASVRQDLGLGRIGFHEGGDNKSGGVAPATSRSQTQGRGRYMGGAGASVRANPDLHGLRAQADAPRVDSRGRSWSGASDDVLDELDPGVDVAPTRPPASGCPGLLSVTSTPNPNQRPGEQPCTDVEHDDDLAFSI